MVVISHLESTDFGADWVRLFRSADTSDPTYVDDRTPELAIAVLPSHQGQGAGTSMMTGLIEKARGVYPAISLGVRAGILRCGSIAAWAFERLPASRTGWERHP